MDIRPNECKPTTNNQELNCHYPPPPPQQVSTPASLSGTPTLLFSGPRAGRKRRLKDSIAALSCDTDNLESPMVPAHKRRSSYNDTPSRMSISASSILDGSQTPESCSSAKLAGTKLQTLDTDKHAL